MKKILKKRDFLNDNEIKYLNDVSKKFVIHQSDIYHQTKIDQSKLREYRTKVIQFVSDNFDEKYRIKAIELNRITADDYRMDGFHNDSSDLTFVTYFNMDFEGGKFEYIDNDGNNVFINPEVNLTLIMDQNPSHRVTKVTKGERFSLVVFLTLILENEKNRKTII